MMKWISLLAVAAILFATGPAFASSNDLAYKGITELETITQAESGDYVPVYDASTDNVKKMDATAQSTTGDLTFRTDLLAAGRVNAASSMASSSTAIGEGDLSYVVLRKYIGGNSSLDETDGGTHLPDGTPGQVLIIIAMDVDTDGSWIVTPDTSVTLTTITFDAAGETVTLLYVDDTIGWTLIANEAATVVFERQTGIPTKP